MPGPTSHEAINELSGALNDAISNGDDTVVLSVECAKALEGLKLNAQQESWLQELSSRDTRIRLAKACTQYKHLIQEDDTDDLKEYNEIELSELNRIAENLDLVGDYYAED
mgnify:CR=1 FL=1